MSVLYQETERQVKFVADTESVKFVMQTGDLPDANGTKRPPDGRITALRKIGVPKRPSGLLFGAERGREDQEAQIDIIIRSLSFQAGMPDNTIEGIKKYMIVQKPFGIRVVCDGSRIAPVIIKAFLKKINGVGVQQTAVGNQSIFAQFGGRRNLIKVFFQKGAPEQFVPYHRRNAEMKEASVV